MELLERMTGSFVVDTKVLANGDASKVVNLGPPPVERTPCLLKAL